MDIRPAQPRDKAAIAAFTTDTFEWGDYVADAFDGWLADPEGQVLVATNDQDEPVGLAHLAVLSANEAWAQAARVHPDHRRQGVATRLTEAGEAWARDRGAQVIRLVTEEWNEPAQRQVEQSGYRQVARWVMAQRAVGNAVPVVPGNGGRRAPAEERLRRAPAAEAEPAYLAWSSSELVAAGHGLFPVTGWMWRQMHIEDVIDAARVRAFWECPAGWMIGSVEEDLFRVSWMATSPEDAYRLVRAGIDLAGDQDAERLRMLIPAVDWLIRACDRAAMEVHPLLLYERALS